MIHVCKTNDFCKNCRSYDESPKPETSVIVSLAQQLNLDPYIVRVWFTNRWPPIQLSNIKNASKILLCQEAKGQANRKRWPGVSRSGLSQPLVRGSAANNAVFTCIVVDNGTNNATSHVADIAVSLRRSIHAERSHPDQGDESHIAYSHDFI